MTRSPGPAWLRGGRRAFLLGASLSLARVGPSRAQGPDPRQAVTELYDALRAATRMGPATPFKLRFDRLAGTIDRVFDLDAILRASVGLRWSALNDAQKQALFSVFRAFTIASYTANFDKDGGEKFEVLPETKASGADQIVQTKLIPDGGDPVRIDYVMRAANPGWRVTDVLFEGSISRVAVQRSDFRALLASGDPTPLIDSLKKKVADLSAGAMRL